MISMVKFFTIGIAAWGRKAKKTRKIPLDISIVSIPAQFKRGSANEQVIHWASARPGSSRLIELKWDREIGGNHAPAIWPNRVSRTGILPAAASCGGAWKYPNKNPPGKPGGSSCEGRDRTSDLRVMSPTSYRCSTSRYNEL